MDVQNFCVLYTTIAFRTKKLSPVTRGVEGRAPGHATHHITHYGLPSHKVVDNGTGAKQREACRRYERKFYGVYSHGSECAHDWCGEKAHPVRAPILTGVAMQLEELRERDRYQHQSILGYWLVLSLRVIIGKATAITTLISTPRSGDFQSMEASIYAADGR
jgi:hypothetical protein